MASENRPGVIVVQELSETPAAVTSPTLVPVIIAPCHQIIEALESDGSLNGDALFADAQYNQAALTITQAEFPDPRANIDEINVDESEVSTRLYFGGLLTLLARGSNGDTGSAFLASANHASKPAFVFPVSTGGTYDFTSYGDSGANLILAFNIPSAGVTSSDVTIALTGTMAASDVADAINDAVGATVAEAIVVDNSAAPTGTNDYGIDDSAASELVQGQDTVIVYSTLFGATSSLYIRANAGALDVLFNNGGTHIDTSLDHCLEGAGFRAQDDEDGDLTSPWIEWHRGAFKYGASGSDLTDNSAADDAFNANTYAGEDWAGLINLDGEFSPSKAIAMDFVGGDANIPLSAATASDAGDEFWADGSQVGSGEITVVETTRFKVGTLSLSLSTFDSDGNPSVRIYENLEFNTPSHGTPFAPKYAYFIANNLVFGDISPEGEAASVTGSNSGWAEQSAYVVSDSASSYDFSTPVALAGATLTVSITEDGVEGDDQVHTFTDTFASLADVATDIEDGLDGITVEAVDLDGDGDDDALAFYTVKTGSDQRVTVKTTGEYSIAGDLGFTDSASADGKDSEFGDHARAVGGPIHNSSIQAQTLTITVTDSFGTHTREVSISSGGTLDDVCAEIAGVVADTSGSYALRSGTAGDGVGYAFAIVDFVDVDGDLPGDDSFGSIRITSTQVGSGVDVDVASDVAYSLMALGFYDEDGEGSVLTSSGASMDLSWAGALTGASDTIVITDNGAGGSGNAWTFTDTTGYASIGDLLFDLNTGSNWTGSANPNENFQFYVIFDADTVASSATVAVRGLDQDADGVQLDCTTAGAEFTSATGFAATETGSETTGTSTTPSASDSGVDGLASTRLAFTLDSNPYVYEVNFTSNSLEEAIDAVNEEVGGAIDIASEDGGAMVLTSSFAGAASGVDVDDDASDEVNNSNGDGAHEVLGLNGGSDTGAGRPNPDFYLNGDGSAILGANILRNKSSGVPYSLSSAISDIYLEYTGLRLDVSPSADSPGLLTFNDVDTMLAAIGPVSTENPLALGCFLALSNAPSQTVSALGLAEVSDAAPMGTITAHASALDMLEAKEVYAMAPLTDDAFVQQLYATHVSSMSEPEERGERIAFIWQPEPSRAVDTSIQSGEDAETNGTDNAITIGDNPISSVVGAGISDPSDVAADDGLYVELVMVSLGETAVANYSISSINGVIVMLRTSFDDGENDDGFYSTATLEGDGDLTDMTYSIRVRGDELLVAGTEIPDLNAIAAAGGEQGTGYANRRVFFLYGDSVDTSLDGVTFNVEGYYASAAIAGMVAEQSPQQPFTRLSVTGFSAVYGTDDKFGENQLDVIADGGRYVLINQGGMIASRHQRSTAITSIEARELSITKAIDYLAKGLRATNRVYIGRYVINPGFIDQLVMSNEGFLARTVQSGVVNAASLKSVLQDESAPDTVLIEVEVAPAYPCNKIRITIVS